MKNVFGYPEFDAEGEEILCTYDNAYSDMLMDIRVYRMEPGRKRGFCRRGEETAVLLLSGTVTFGWEGRTETVCPPCLRRGGDHRGGADRRGDPGPVHEE